MLYRRRANAAIFGDASVFREVLIDAVVFLRREVLAVRENVLRFASAGAECKPTVEAMRFPPVVLAPRYCAASDTVLTTLHATWL